MATTAATVTAPSAQYGGVELKANYQKYWSIGFAIALAIHMSLIGTYYLVQVLTAEEAPTMMVRMAKYSELGPPPSMTSANTPPPEVL